MSKWKDKTRDGTPVRIYAEDGEGNYPIHGAFYDSGWHCETWDSKGFAYSGQETNLDLIPNVPEIDWSKQPDWCKAIAMDSDGIWHRHNDTPHTSRSVWATEYNLGFRMHPSEYPAWSGDWRDSLCVRQEGEPK